MYASCDMEIRSFIVYVLSLLFMGTQFVTYQSQGIPA